MKLVIEVEADDFNVYIARLANGLDGLDLRAECETSPASALAKLAVLIQMHDQSVTTEGLALEESPMFRDLVGRMGAKFDATMDKLLEAWEPKE